MLGYEKNEKLEFNYKKSCGLWLIAVAIVIVVATIIGGQNRRTTNNKYASV